MLQSQNFATLQIKRHPRSPFRPIAANKEYFGSNTIENVCHVPLRQDAVCCLNLHVQPTIRSLIMPSSARRMRRLSTAARKWRKSTVNVPSHHPILANLPTVAHACLITPSICRWQKVPASAFASLSLA